MATDITAAAPAATPVLTSTTNGTTYLVRFPPFPPTPAGVTITPFKQFKERGIRVEPGGQDNETEVDALGVPTVPLASMHSTDWCKTNTKRQKFNKSGGGKKKKKRRTGLGMSSGPTAGDWEEYWEEREAAYRIKESYNPHIDASERFYQGAWDFKNQRPWPLADKQSGPVFIWGEFVRFSGIPPGPEGVSTAETTRNVETNETNNDSDSDLEQEEDDGPNDGVLNLHDVISADAALKAQAKTEAFLRDPALMLKVFFSSYARDRGIIWTEVNLTGAPILIRFFINFLIDNNVLPKREENAIKHESTRRIIDLALKELPLTSRLAKVWPDNFSLACRECWGSKLEVFSFRPISPLPETQDVDVQGNVSTVDSSSTNWNGWGSADNASTNNAQQPAGWGASATNTWQDGANPGSSWGADPLPTGENDNGITREWDESNVIGIADHIPSNDVDAGDNSGTEWETLQQPTFFSFLGPTALPLTHTTGVVEASVRRIKAVHPPSSDTSPFSISRNVSAEAVERNLRRTFGVVVFEPWVNWNKGEEPHLAMPRILSSSRGAVILPEGGPEESRPTAPGVLPPFDPHKDEISVLVLPEHLELFSIGMGCMCTWVQMARCEDLKPQDSKKKKNAKTDRLWYVEESLRVVPSYYTYLG